METTNRTLQQTQTTTDLALNPSKIMQIGMGFLSSKVLLIAVKLGLFTLLAPKPLLRDALMQVFNNSLIQGQTMNTREIKLALEHINSQEQD